jgi:hypothetical protein
MDWRTTPDCHHPRKRAPLRQIMVETRRRGEFFDDPANWASFVVFGGLVGLKMTEADL